MVPQRAAYTTLTAHFVIPTAGGIYARALRYPRSMPLASSQRLEGSASREKDYNVHFTKDLNEISVNQRNQWFLYRAGLHHFLPLCHPDGRRDLRSCFTLSWSMRLASSQRLVASASEKGDKVQFTKHFNAISVNQRNQWFPFRVQLHHTHLPLCHPDGRRDLRSRLTATYYPPRWQDHE